MNARGVETGLSRDDSRLSAGSLTWTSGAETDSPSGSSNAHGQSWKIREGRPIFWMHEVPKVPSAMSALPINAEPGASAKAIISEIQVCAERLIAHGETSSIDLRFLKSMPEERATLAVLLGRGEVSAVVDSIGRSEVQETSIPCVWWIRHFNSDNETVGELIEITDIPELLVGDRQAVAFALESLRASVRSGAC